MKVFISWSGAGSKSHQVAELLRAWLPKVIQNLPCFLSSADIEGGAIWLPKMLTELQESNVGILCLTRESMNKPWLLFEAGALAKQVASSRVCPLLIDIRSDEVFGPLGNLQMKGIDKLGIYGIVQVLNAARGSASLSETDLQESFATRWGEFEGKIAGILKSTLSESKLADKPSDPVLNEILTIVRGLASANVVKEKKPTRKRDWWDIVIEATKTDRPLISAWVQSAEFSVLDDDHDHLTVYFDSGKSLARDMCDRPNNKNFFLKMLEETPIKSISFVLLPPEI